MTCYYQWGEPPKAAEFWSIRVKLNRSRGQVNPALFDYEAQVLSRGIVARGYVADSVQNYRMTVLGGEPEQAMASFSNRHWRYQHHHLRERIRDIVIKRLPDTAARGLIVGLLIGESSKIPVDAWQALSHTGTNHLLIISGLHVGLVFGFGYWLLARMAWFKITSTKAFLVCASA